MGVLFQDGALFGSLNVYDKHRVPAAQAHRQVEDEIREIVMKPVTEVGLEKSLAKLRTRSPAVVRKPPVRRRW